MHNHLLALLSSLHSEVLQLNEYLKEDQKLLPKRQREAIEQADIEKLHIRNHIELLIQDLLKLEQWPEFQKAMRQPEQYPQYELACNLWTKIQDAFDNTQDYIEINQQVIQASLDYYSQIFHNIITALETDKDQLVYDRDGATVTS